MRRMFVALDEVSEYDSESYWGSDVSENFYMDESKVKTFLSDLRRDPDFENQEALAVTEVYLP